MTFNADSLLQASIQYLCGFVYRYKYSLHDAAVTGSYTLFLAPNILNFLVIN